MFDFFEDLGDVFSDQGDREEIACPEEQGEDQGRRDARWDELGGEQATQALRQAEQDGDGEEDDPRSARACSAAYC